MLSQAHETPRTYRQCAMQAHLALIGALEMRSVRVSDVESSTSAEMEALLPVFSRFLVSAVYVVNWFDSSRKDEEEAVPRPVHPLRLVPISYQDYHPWYPYRVETGAFLYQDDHMLLLTGRCTASSRCWRDSRP